jgi:hypothetical protein
MDADVLAIAVTTDPRAWIVRIKIDRLMRGDRRRPSLRAHQN